MKVYVKHIARNIQLLSSGNFEVRVYVTGAGRKIRYFRSGTPLAAMRAWVKATREQMKRETGRLGLTRAELRARGVGAKSGAKSIQATSETK